MPGIYGETDYAAKNVEGTTPGEDDDLMAFVFREVYRRLIILGMSLSRVCGGSKADKEKRS